MKFHSITTGNSVMFVDDRGCKVWFCPPTKGILATLLKLTLKGVGRKVFRERGSNGKTKTEKYTNK